MIAKSFIFLFVASAASGYDITLCDPKKPDLMGISSITTDPAQPTPGKDVKITLTASPQHLVQGADRLTLTAKAFGVTVGTKHMAVGSLTTNATLPAQPGSHVAFTTVYTVPALAPTGIPITIEFDTTDTATSQDYSCVSIQIKFSLEFTFRRVEPLAETPEQKLEAWIYQLLDLQKNQPEILAKEIRESGLAAIAPTLNNTALLEIAETPTNGLPTVVAHGMGDSCFNPGMKSITQAIGQKTSAYSVCVPTGDTQSSDTINGFLKNMDDSIDVFAKKIQADPKLKGGFNAAGFSQGNSLIRGYIQKYNNPPVKSFLSVHGTVMGVGGVPQCNPAGLLGVVCRPLAELCGTLGYTSLVQKHLFQADYFRDPTKLDKESYKKSQLAQLNNEGDSPNPDYKTNFGKTEQFVMVKAMGDTMVFPNEGEHWGTWGDGSFEKSKVLTMKETSVYQKDLFGLKTADEAGKIKFEQTPGNHLQFTETDLFGWISKYWAAGSNSTLSGGN